MDKEIYKILENLLIDSQNNNITEDEFFKLIGQLDKKYCNNPYYQLNINGTIVNIGSDLRSKKILCCALLRLKKYSKDLDSYKQNKINYDTGNCYQNLESIVNDPSIQSIQKIINSENYDHARNYFSLVNKDKNDPTFKSAFTNEANILEKTGRHYEAIILYDSILNEDSSFGMALGNKAIALEYYFRLSPFKPLRLIKEAESLLKLALEDENIEQTGGLYIKKIFKEKLEYISNFLKKSNYENTKEKKPNNLSKYYTFCLENNLFLNYDFGYYFDKYSLIDNIFPKFISELEDFKEDEIKKYKGLPKNIYYSIKLLNQIYEDYTTSRLLFFNALTENYNKYDKNISYLSTNDYNLNSTNFGIIKIVLSKLFNILDKLAQLVFMYFKIEQENIYIWDLLNNKFKEIILEQNNFQLLALYSLAKDFQEDKIYSKFKTLRNLITHEFIDVISENQIIPIDEEYKDYFTTKDNLENLTKELFSIVKAGIIYFCMSFEENKFKKGGSELTGPLFIRPQ